MTESDNVKAILDFLHLSGFYAQRINSGSNFATYRDKFGKTKTRCIKGAELGTPDVLACVFGIFIGIEVKKDAKTCQTWQKHVENFKRDARIPPSAAHEIAQFKQMQRIGKAGGVCCLVHSVEGVQRMIEELKKNLKSEAKQNEAKQNETTVDPRQTKIS